ncbi:MAG: DUF374 domain-containing protein [Actinomycetota bacterium]
MFWAALKRDPKFRWFWRAFSLPVASFMYVNARMTLRTSSVSESGPGAGHSGAAVYVNWHKYVPFLCIHHGQHRRWLLMSSAPYLEPIAMWCRWMGLTVIRGAPGERSRESLGRLLEALKAGHSVVLAADGPAGPGFRAKTGCVELARAAGVPVIPVACRSQKGKANKKRWDQMYQVGRFDQIEVWYENPVLLCPEEDDAVALKRVQTALDRAEAAIMEPSRLVGSR